jgi:hypothetical protein
MRRSVFRLTIFALLLMLTACAGQSSASTATPTPSPATTPTATVPTGDYAFVRDGDLWAKTGAAPSHALTQLHLNAVGARWGSLTWSPDHATIAFVLYAPPFAPGFLATNPAQSTGSLFIVDVASERLTQIGTGTVFVPLQGQHLAWTQTSDGKYVLLFTRSGLMEQYILGTQGPTILAGPQSVWEIAVRNHTLFYSTLATPNAEGVGTAELHTFDLVALTDHLVVKLGPASLPIALCGSLVCLPDPSVPAVPYAWSVSGDGSLVAFETTLAQSSTVVTATTVTPTPGKGTPTATPQPSPTPTSAPTNALSFYTAHSDGTKPQPIFTALPTLPQGVAVALALSPNGQYAALSLAQASGAIYGPLLQSLAAGGTVQNEVMSEASVFGTPSWSPDNLGFALTANPLGSNTPTPSIITFLVSGQSANLEQNGTNLVWGP